jgi:glucose dehydrogenase
MLRASRRLKLGLSAVVLGSLATWVAVAQQPRQEARKIDDAALRDAPRIAEEWLSYNMGWSEQRFSQLNQINAQNVNRLGLGYYVDIPSARGNPQNRQEGTPLVSNGIIYSIAPWSVVYAVDARTGKEVWHQDPDVNQQVWQSRICCGVVNRGIALYQDKIIAPVVDGRLREAGLGIASFARQHGLHHHHGPPRHQGRQGDHRRERRRVRCARLL